MTDSDIIEIAEEFRAGILGERCSSGMCAVVAWPLAGFLIAAYGIPCECVESESPAGAAWVNHVWIKLADGRALDPTFDQFGTGPSVYLGPPTDFHQEPTP
jgi:hypothetical protein